MFYTYKIFHQMISLDDTILPWDSVFDTTSIGASMAYCANIKGYLFYLSKEILNLVTYIYIYIFWYCFLWYFLWISSFPRYILFRYPLFISEFSFYILNVMQNFLGASIFDILFIYSWIFISTFLINQLQSRMFLIPFLFDFPHIFLLYSFKNSFLSYLFSTACIFFFGSCSYFLQISLPLCCQSLFFSEYLMSLPPGIDRA